MDILFRKKKKFCFFLLLIALVLATFAACRSFAPYDVEGRWVCMEPYFTLEYRHDAEGRLVKDEAILEIDGVLQPVEIGYEASYFVVFLVDPTSTVVDYEDRLLTGEWKFQGKQLVFSIEEDFVFDGAYSEICFYPDE